MLIEKGTKPENRYTPKYTILHDYRTVDLLKQFHHDYTYLFKH